MKIELTIDIEGHATHINSDELVGYTYWTKDDIRERIEDEVNTTCHTDAVMSHIDWNSITSGIEYAMNLAASEIISDAIYPVVRDVEDKLNSLRDDLDPIILSDYDDVPLENIDDESVVQSLFEQYSDDDIDDDLLLLAIRELLAEMTNSIESYADYLIDHKDDYEDCETEEEVVDAAENIDLAITYFEARRAAHKYWKEVRQ